MKNEKPLFITVGIPTYNSSVYLSDCLKSVLECKSVNEVIISDDGSCKNEINEIEKIIEFFKIKYKKNIFLFKQNTNVGAFINKLSIFDKSMNDFVYLLDSDNIAAKNLDFIVQKKIRSDSAEPYLFQPGVMYQFWNNHKISKIMGLINKKYRVIFTKSDIVVCAQDAAKSLYENPGSYNLNDFEISDESFKHLENFKNKHDNFPIEKWIMWVLNCGNFIVNKNLILKIANEGLRFQRSVNSLDAVTFSYLWLKSGNQIKLFSDFYHHHRKRSDSVSFVENKNTAYAIEFFIKNIIKLIKVNEK